ncbi:MAG TPA: two-component regulator propeller domain-containing protein, partial [Bacillota bacterium]|nr:two-component regulator propeller domain-containing protein [Bacillota bacterium]
MHLRALERRWPLQWITGWLLLVCALVPCGSAAQESARFSARLWQREDGLPHSIVQAITQTRDGYLWVGTREGLARFDGVRFAVISLSPEAPHPSITSLCESRDGSLWIGTEAAGLARLKDGVFTRYGRTQGLRSETVRALQEAEDGSLWIGSDEGLTQWKAGRFQLPADEAISRGTVWAMSRGREGLLWAATSRGLMRIKGQSLTTNAIPEGLTPETVRGMFCGPDGTLWIGT